MVISYQLPLWFRSYQLKDLRFSKMPLVCKYDLILFLQFDKVLATRFVSETSQIKTL